VALAAARQNFKVILVDEASGCLERASFRNEGKIHLGYVYANDAGFETADLMIRAALRFAPLLEQWLPEPPPWDSLRSNPFCYIVARDSMVETDRLFEHYDRVERRCLELTASDPKLHYLGRRPASLWSVCSPPPQVSEDFARASVRTQEVSLDLVQLKERVAAALASHPGISLLYGHRVDEVARNSHGFAVQGRSGEGRRWHHHSDCVVNCLWDGRLVIDAQLDLVPDRPWVHRLKHRVVGGLPESLSDIPSMTIVLGPYGDVVTRPNGEFLHLSWYPTCMTAWSTDPSPPSSWAASMQGALPTAAQQIVCRETLAAFEQVVPGISQIRNPVVDGGSIFCWGETDIDDAMSELHHRHDIGVLACDGYFSINTGKLTTAPYFAQQLVEMLA